MSSNEEEFHVSTADLADAEVFVGFFALEEMLKTMLEQLQSLNDELDEFRDALDEYRDDL